MSTKIKKIILGGMIGVVLMLILGLICSFAEGKEELVLPAKTEFIKEERRMLAGQETLYRYYMSPLAAEQVKDFFRQKLPESGWQEKNLLQELERLPNFPLESSAKKTLERELVFEKENEVAIIIFPPGELFDDPYTRFTISQSRRDISGEVSSETDYFPQLLAKPKKEIAPVYPGASLMTLTEEGNSYKATYATVDEKNLVRKFYQDRLLNYGWYLREEEQESGAASAADCPTCKKRQGKEVARELPMEYEEMAFANAEGDALSIVLSQFSLGGKIKELEGFTIIMVDYAEKKE